jgi:hypothetical protein
MSWSVAIKDWQSKTYAKVSKVYRELAGSRRYVGNAVWVTIAGVEPGFSLPTSVGITGLQYEGQLTFASSPSMNVNGSVTPVTFTLAPDPTYDIVVTTMFFYGVDGSIKINNFLGQASALTNGISVTFKSDQVVTTFETIKTTAQLAKFATKGGFDLLTEAAGDACFAHRELEPGFIIRKQNTFGAGQDDYINCIIRDNLTNITDLQLIVRGVRVEAGTV